MDTLAIMDKPKSMKKDYNHTYYCKHKEDIINHLSKNVECECGGIYKLYNLSRHKKTMKHKQGLTFKT